MELIIENAGLYRRIATPNEGWQGSSTGLYLHSGPRWYDAKRPFPIHHCKPHSIGVIGTGYIRIMVLRCACGSYLQAKLEAPWDPGQQLVWDRGVRWLNRNARLYRWAGFVTSL